MFHFDHYEWVAEMIEKLIDALISKYDCDPPFDSLKEMTADHWSMTKKSIAIVIEGSMIGRDQRPRWIWKEENYTPQNTSDTQIIPYKSTN